VKGSGGSSLVPWCSRASPVTSLVEGGTTCWSSSGAHDSVGSDRVGGSSVNGADGRGAEATRKRASEREEEKMEEASPLRTRGLAQLGRLQILNGIHVINFGIEFNLNLL
jgi:hypothetical protein